MKIKQIEVYQYSELDETAKEKARIWWIEASAGDTFDWECIQEDAKTVGLNLKGTDNRGNMTGDFIESARECAEKIIANHGESCETYKTASAFLKERDEIVDAAPKDDNGEFENEYALDKALDACESEFLRSILEDYRIMVEKEAEYQQSEEYIADVMEANEYEFTKEGKRI